MFSQRMNLFARLGILKLQKKCKHVPATEIRKSIDKRDIILREDVGKLVSRFPIMKLSDWEVVKEDIFKMSRQISASNIDSIILSACVGNKNFAVAENFLEYLKETQGEPNLATMGKIFRLYHAMYVNGGLDEDKEAHIYNTYLNVKKKHEVLDSITNEQAIMALAVTKHWRICLDLLKEIKISCTPNTWAYSFTAVGAFRHKEYEIGWSVLNEMLEKNRIPISECYLSCIEKAEQIDVLLNFLGNNDLICEQDVAEALLNHFKKIGKFADFVKIGNKYNARVKTLPQLTLTPTEFASLKKAFFDRAIVGKDIFRKSTPDEVFKFRAFMDQNNKYDVVIDGLNVAYSSGTKIPVEVTSSLVAAVVGFYTKQNKKVLVCGRSHMSRWPRKNWSFIKSQADVFLAQNVSQDDPYLIYCALNSGPNTIIVSRDLMRGHKFALVDAEHKRLFSRWFSQCQHQLIRVLDNGKVLVQPPLPYMRTAQSFSNTWHVPFNVGDEHTNNWLCVKL